MYIHLSATRSTESAALFGVTQGSVYRAYLVIYRRPAAACLSVTTLYCTQTLMKLKSIGLSVLVF